VVVIYQTLETLLKRRAAKVDKQPKGLLCQSKICKQLLGMSRIQTLDRLYFHEDLFVDQQIDPKRGGKAHIFKHDIDWPLPIHIISGSGELRRQYRFVDSFKQAGPKLAMQPDRKVQHIA